MIHQVFCSLCDMVYHMSHHVTISITGCFPPGGIHPPHLTVSLNRDIGALPLELHVQSRAAPSRSRLLKQEGATHLQNWAGLGHPCPPSPAHSSESGQLPAIYRGPREAFSEPTDLDEVSNRIPPTSHANLRPLESGTDRGPPPEKRRPAPEAGAANPRTSPLTDKCPQLFAGLEPSCAKVDQ